MSILSTQFFIFFCILLILQYGALLKLRIYEKQYKIVMCTMALILCSCFAMRSNQYSEKKMAVVSMSEVCTKNLSVVYNEEEKYPSMWIELQNESEREVDLEGWKVIVSGEDTYTISLEDERLEAGESTLVFLDETFQTCALYLIDTSSKIIDQLIVPKLPINTSYSRMNNGEFYVTTCTPFASNSYADILEMITLKAPEFSVESGFYRESFTLQIACMDGEQIYYTLDGSEPNRNSILYEGGILIADASTQPNIWSVQTDLSSEEYIKNLENIDKATVVRAVAYDALGNKSEVVTRTFFVGGRMNEKYQNDTLVISLVADPKDLFGYEDGILVLGETYEQWKEYLGYDPTGEKPDYLLQTNFNQRGRKWERAANLSLFDKGILEIEQRIGLRTRGRASSNGRQKGLTLIARDIYDNNKRFKYDIFGNGRENKKVILKNPASLWRDGLIFKLLDNTALIVPQCRSAQVFINGEYWGLYALMEKCDEDYFADYCSVEKQDVVLYKNGAYGVDEDAGDKHSIEALIEYAKTKDLSKDENYREICQWIDIDSFIDYYVVQIYIDSYDCSETYNMMAWKTRTIDTHNPYADGKWRWIPYDIDLSLRDYQINNLTENPRENIQPYFEHTILKALLQNDEFSRRFKERFCQIESDFEIDKVVVQLEQDLENNIKAMELQQVRFPEKYDSNLTIENEVNNIMEFFDNRREYIENYLSDYFGEDIKSYYG